MYIHYNTITPHCDWLDMQGDCSVVVHVQYIATSVHGDTRLSDIYDAVQLHNIATSTGWTCKVTALFLHNATYWYILINCTSVTYTAI